MTTHRIVIRNGRQSFVYHDDLAALAAQGQVTRASNVEPASEYCGGCSRPYTGVNPCRCSEPRRPVASSGWVADMAPSGGPLLGTYISRQDALDGEREWLRINKGL
jgi:hypothetical protein